ncbi:MAG: hypothetical protein JNG88_15000 [Phycisphaerales bacterium]|nr:hypothetical protein [Phycisphaerales bacterium]
MTTVALSDTQSALGSTLAGSRWYVAAGVVFAAFYFVLTTWLTPRGLDRPAVVIGAPMVGLAVPVYVVLVGMCGFAATKILGARDYLASLEVLCVGVAAWALLGGTMDDWLARFHRSATGASRAPYSALMLEYAVQIAAFAAGLFGIVIAIGSVGPPGTTWRERVTAHWPPLDRNEKAASGVLTVFVICAVAALAMLVFMGPRVAHTHQGQVYFSIFAGFAIGTYAARSTLGRAAPIWYALPPVVLGIVGVILATMNPALPQPFAQINIIPPSALSRPLPIEIITVGIVAASWMLRNLQHAAPPQPAKSN